jgi:hypothetical protein
MRRPEQWSMKKGNKSWLQLYVDAMTERDPYKRLALVRELRRIPREKESDEFLAGVIEDRVIRHPQSPARKSKTARPGKPRPGVKGL